MENLNYLGIQELNATEKKYVEGGYFKEVVLWAIEEYDNIKQGCEDALEEWVNEK